MMIFIVFLVILLIGFIILFINYLGQKKIGIQPVVCYTGAPGTGKTKIGVSRTLRQYRKISFL
jgi:ATP-dependent Lon protease